MQDLEKRIDSIWSHMAIKLNYDEDLARKVAEVGFYWSETGLQKNEENFYLKCFRCREVFSVLTPSKSSIKEQLDVYIASDQQKRIHTRRCEYRTVAASSALGTGRKLQMDDSSVLAENEAGLPDISSLSICRENTTEANSSEKQPGLHHSHPEASALAPGTASACIKAGDNGGECAGHGKGTLNNGNNVNICGDNNTVIINAVMSGTVAETLSLSGSAQKPI